MSKQITAIRNRDGFWIMQATEEFPPDERRNKFYVSSNAHGYPCGMVYLQTSGVLGVGCSGGWFKTLDAVGEAIDKWVEDGSEKPEYEKLLRP